MEGQDSERNDINRISELEEYFEAVELVNDPRFGEIIILVNKYNPDEIIFAKEKMSHSLVDCERDVIQAQERMQLSHDFLLKMIDFSVKYADPESSEEQPTFLVTGFYEYPKHDLSIEIQERQSEGRLFTGDELMQLEINVLEVLTYLKSFKMIHGDIRPKYIYYDTSEQGWHKLVDRLADPSPPNQAQIHNIRKKETLYISPDLYAGLSQKQSRVKHNPYKSDAFSLGLVLLECGTLRSVQDIYKETSIDINVLLELIEEFMTNYEEHTLLKETILWLLDTNEKDRKDSKQVLKIIKEMLQEAEANGEWNQNQGEEGEEGEQGEEGEGEAEGEANENSEQVEGSEYQQYEIVELQMNEGDTSHGAEEIHIKGHVHQTESGIVSEQHIEKNIYHEESETVETEVIDIRKEVTVQQGFVSKTEEIVTTSEITKIKGEQKRETNQSAVTSLQHHQESSQTQMHHSEHRQESSQSLKQEQQRQQSYQSIDQVSAKQQSAQEIKQKTDTEQSGQIQVISETHVEKTEQIIESSNSIVQIEKTEITTIKSSEQKIAVSNVSYEHTDISGNYSHGESNSRAVIAESHQQRQESTAEQQVSLNQSSFKHHSSVEEVCQQKQTSAESSQKETVNQQASSLTHLEQNNIPPMIPESTNNIDELIVDIAPPRVSHPAEYIDKSKLKFDFVHPPDYNPQEENTTEKLEMEMSKDQSNKKTFAQQENTMEAKLVESQIQSSNNNTNSSLYQSTSVSGGVKRYTLGQSITDYKAVVVTEHGGQDRSATKSIGQPEVLDRKISSPITTFIAEPTSHEVRTVYAQNVRSENTNQSSISKQQQFGSANNSNSNLETNISRNTTQDNGVTRSTHPDEPLTRELLRYTSEHQFSNMNLINQSNSKVFRKESNQQLPVYISNGNSNVRYQQGLTQSNATTVNAFPSQIGNSTSSVSYRRINTDGIVLTQNAVPVISAPVNTIRYGSINESARTINGNNQGNVTQYNLTNNNLFRDVEKSINVQNKSYQTIPTTYVNTSSTYQPMQYVHTRTINQSQGQLIQDTRIPQPTVQAPEQVYEVIESEDGGRRYVMKKTTSQAFLSNVSHAVQNHAIIGQPTSLISQVHYSTSYSGQPQIYTSSIGNTQGLINEFKPQTLESETQARFVRVLSGGQKQAQDLQTSITQSTSYTANSFRPSSTFVNAVIPGFNGQSR